MHPWHDIPLGPQAPREIPAVVEVPRGSKNNYELDKQTGMLKVDRVLFSAVHYPANYGFIPRTYADDRDPLDILVLGQEAVYPLTVMTARPIGLLHMTDEGEQDDKIIAVHVNDPDYAHYRAMDELPAHRMEEVRRFFETYKELERKQVSADAFAGAADAERVIDEAIALYNRTFG